MYDYSVLFYKLNTCATFRLARVSEQSLENTISKGARYETRCQLAL